MLANARSEDEFRTLSGPAELRAAAGRSPRGRDHLVSNWQTCFSRAAVMPGAALAIEVWRDRCEECVLRHSTRCSTSASSIRDHSNASGKLGKNRRRPENFDDGHEMSRPTRVFAMNLDEESRE